MGCTEVERNPILVCCARNVVQSTVPETRLTSTFLPGLYSEITECAFNWYKDEVANRLNNKFGGNLSRFSSTCDCCNNVFHNTFLM